MCTYILSGTPSKVDTVLACSEYGGICDSETYYWVNFVQFRCEYHCTKYKERMTCTVTVVDLCVVGYLALWGKLKHSCT